MRDAKSELTVSESEKEAMRLQYKKSLDRHETEKEQLEFQVTPIILEFMFFLSLFFFPFFSVSSFIFYLFWYYKFIMTFNDKGKRFNPFIMYSSDEKFRMNDSEDNWETLWKSHLWIYGRYIRRDPCAIVFVRCEQISYD